jgi:polysaccharide pyruvyl transferase CsaB
MGGRVREYDVALCGYFGFENLGDEMLLASAIQNLAGCGVPKERICVFSNAPEESLAKFSIRSYNRWSARTVSAALKRSRSLLFPGGGLFQDTTSAKSCLYYWGVARLAEICGCGVWALGQSVGPLSTFAGRWLAKDALRRMDFFSVRDDASRCLSKKFGVDAQTMPDIVFGLSVPPVAADPSGPFLVNVRPTGNARSLSAMLEAIRAIASAGREIRGIAMSPEDARAFARYRESGEIPLFEVEVPRSVEEFSAAAAGCAAAIGMRLHFAVLSMLSGLPVVVAAYDPKVSSFAERFELSDLTCCDNQDIFNNITKTLTNTRVHDKKKQRRLCKTVSRFFEEGLSCILGKKPK